MVETIYTASKRRKFQELEEIMEETSKLKALVEDSRTKKGKRRWAKKELDKKYVELQSWEPNAAGMELKVKGGTPMQRGGTLLLHD